MTRKSGIMFLGLMMALAFSSLNLFAQYASNTDESVKSVVTILLAADGQVNAVGSGLIVRSDGYILTPYSLVRGAREIQVRLSNGEIYDKAEIVSTDERRNVAILRINASNLTYIPYGTSEESQVGSKVVLIANPNGSTVIKNNLMLNSVQMADMVPGAGKGYRLMQFDAVPDVNLNGALVLDTTGRSLGIITTTPDIKGQNIAVPLTSIVGMIRSLTSNNNTAAISSPLSTIYQSSSQFPPVSPPQTPYVIPQSSVSVPERGVTALSAKGPGSVVLKPHTVPEILAASKTIYVTSRSVTFKPEHLVNELSKRSEMTMWGFSFVDERDLADLILEIDHVVLTWKYTFKIYSERSGVIVATGSVVILDGNVGAPDMASRVVDKLMRAGAAPKKTPAATEAVTKK